MDSELKLGSGGENEERKKNEGKSNRRMDEEEETTKKKPKFDWTLDLDQQFVYAYNQLVNENQFPTPQEILQRMNYPPELTIAEISTHLRDYRDSLPEYSQQQQPGNSSTDVAFGQQLSSSTSSASNYHLQAVQQPPAIGRRIDRRFNNYGYENPYSRLPFGSQSGIPNSFHLPTNNSFQIDITSSRDTIEFAAGNNRIIISLSDLMGVIREHNRQLRQIFSTGHQEVPPFIWTNIYPRNNNNNNSRQSLVRPFGFDVPHNQIITGGDVGSSSITGQNNRINNIPPNISQQQQLNSSSLALDPLRTSRPSISQQLQQQLNSSSRPFHPLRTSRPSISQQQKPGNSSTGVAFGCNDHRQAASLVPSSVQQNLQAIGGRIDWRFNYHGYENPNSRLPFGNMNNIPSGGALRNIQNMEFGSQSGIPNLPTNNSFWIIIHYSRDTIDLTAGNNRIIIPLSALIGVLQDHFRQQEVPPVIGMNIYPRNNNNNSRRSLVRPFGDIGSSSITGQNNRINNIPPNIRQQQQQHQLNSSVLPFELLKTSNNTERRRETITLDLISALDQQPQEEGRGPGGNEDGSGNLPD